MPKVVKVHFRGVADVVASHPLEHAESRISRLFEKMGADVIASADLDLQNVSEFERMIDELERTLRPVDKRIW